MTIMNNFTSFHHLKRPSSTPSSARHMERSKAYLRTVVDNKNKISTNESEEMLFSFSITNGSSRNILPFSFGPRSRSRVPGSQSFCWLSWLVKIVRSKE